jgi:hypothetical protein
MLYSYLSKIKFVVEAKSEGGSFEDKYIAKFWQKLHVMIDVKIYQVIIQKFMIHDEKEQVISPKSLELYIAKFWQKLHVMIDSKI